MSISSVYLSQATKPKQKNNIMSYIKISNRNLKAVKVTILSQGDKFVKVVREDRVNRFVMDVVFFNKLSGKPYMVNVKEIA